MSKVFKKFRSYVLDGNTIAKFFNVHKPGERIAPNNLPSENAKYELRLDAGEVNNGRKNLYLQVNSEATNTALKKFKSRHGTHANIATTSISMDTPANKQEEELRKAMEDVENQFKSKVG